MRDYRKEFESRVKWIAERIKDAGANGVVFGNSGGKDSALAGILCKAACGNTLGVIMPCQSTRNYGEDKAHALELAKQYDIEALVVDLTAAKEEIEKAVSISSRAANTNINPRLRMIMLYALAQDRNYLVAGTGNRSEIKMGYFTKWGDGACDFNPVADLTATEVKEFLIFLNAPESITAKAPSAGLWEGQTDEAEMGLSYKEIDDYILTGRGTLETKQKIRSAHKRTSHKRKLPVMYSEKNK